MHSILYDPPEIEYLDGHPFPKVSPKRTHALVQRFMMAALERCIGERGEFAAEWRFDLGEVDDTPTEFVPDIAFVSYARLDPLSDEEAEEPPFAPDVAIEIRSPSHRAGLLARKVRKYLATGAELVLDVDPENQCIIAHDQHGSRTYAPDTHFVHPAMPWLEFEVADIFPKPRKRDHPI